jgi:hypothetical protein
MLIMFSLGTSLSFKKTQNISIEIHNLNGAKYNAEKLEDTGHCFWLEIPAQIKLTVL